VTTVGRDEEVVRNNIPKQIQEQIQEQNISVPWQQIIATRNRLIHGYFGIDNDILWSIIQDNIPPLIIELQKIIADLNKKS
jgi:uncharacterized protein with HEPN domain